MEYTIVAYGPMPCREETGRTATDDPQAALDAAAAFFADPDVTTVRIRRPDPDDEALGLVVATFFKPADVEQERNMTLLPVLGCIEYREPREA